MSSRFDRNSALAIAFALLAAPGAGSELHAQGRRENVDALHRADCRLALQAILTGKPEPKWNWAVDKIAGCDDSAGEVVPSWMRRPMPDSLDLLEVFAAASTVRDQRILDAAVEIARDEALSWRQRVNAIQVMGAYVDPRVIIEPDDITSAPNGYPKARMLGHGHQIDGTSPLAEGHVATIRAILESLAAETSDPRVKASARVFAGLARNRESP